jgi:hypothetical protein
MSDNKAIMYWLERIDQKQNQIIQVLADIYKQLGCKPEETTSDTPDDSEPQLGTITQDSYNW